MKDMYHCVSNLISCHLTLATCAQILRHAAVVELPADPFVVGMLVHVVDPFLPWTAQRRQTIGTLQLMIHATLEVYDAMRLMMTMRMVNQAISYQLQMITVKVKAIVMTNDLMMMRYYQQLRDRDDCDAMMMKAHSQSLVVVAVVFLFPSQQRLMTSSSDCYDCYSSYGQPSRRLLLRHCYRCCRCRCDAPVLPAASSVLPLVDLLLRLGRGRGRARCHCPSLVLSLRLTSDHHQRLFECHY